MARAEVLGLEVLALDLPGAQVAHQTTVARLQAHRLSPTMDSTLASALEVDQAVLQQLRRTTGCTQARAQDLEIKAGAPRHRQQTMANTPALELDLDLKSRFHPLPLKPHQLRHPPLPSPQ